MKKILILFDETSVEENIRSGHGFSLLIGDDFLFDTGNSGTALFYNMNRLGILPEQIREVFISHVHDDHTGGLWAMLKQKENLTVYGCTQFGEIFEKEVRKLQGKLVNVQNLQEIANETFSTQPMDSVYKGCPMPEHSVILKTENGISVITGCAHPGIVSIVKYAQKNFPNDPIYTVLGGFHLYSESTERIVSIANELKSMGVQKVAPAHCTGREGTNIFKDIFGKDCVSVTAGVELYV